MSDLIVNSAPAPRAGKAPAVSPKTFHQANNVRSDLDTQEADTTAGQLAALATRERAFNYMAEERAEDQREESSLDTLFLAELKQQDEVLKSFLRLAS